MSSKFYINYLPQYIPILFTNYELKIWSEDANWKSTRITIETKEGLWRATIKKGNYQNDLKRVSKYLFNESNN